MKTPSSHIVLAGGSGFLGNKLATHFTQQGYEVVILSRGSSRTEGKIRYQHWDGKTLGDWTKQLEGAEALINLSGKSVDCRYNEANKAAILSSRLDTTHILGEAITHCATSPLVWLNASSATIYRDSYDQDMSEDAGELDPNGFSEHVCHQWEAALNKYPTPLTRKVAMRISIVLGNGGAMGPLKMLTRFFLGGHQGSGKQYFSWIHIDDFIGVIDYLLNHTELDGPINVTAPNPLPNSDCMAALRKAMHRPFGIPHPKFLLEIGAFFIRTETELLLKSRRVIPKRLLEAGYTFYYPTVQKAFDNLIN